VSGSAKEVALAGHDEVDATAIASRVHPAHARGRNAGVASAAAIVS